MFLPTKAGRILVSTFEANKKQDWKIKNGKKKKKSSSTKPFHKLTRLNGINYLKGFHLYLNFQKK